MKIGRFFSTSLLILPFVEFFLFFQVAAIIGLFPALGAIALSALLGISVLKSVGLSSLPRIQMALTRGEIPAQEVADSTLTGLGAVLLIIPGFMTDLLSLLWRTSDRRAHHQGGYQSDIFMSRHSLSCHYDPLIFISRATSRGFFAQGLCEAIS